MQKIQLLLTFKKQQICQHAGQYVKYVFQKWYVQVFSLWPASLQGNHLSAAWLSSSAAILVSTVGTAIGTAVVTARCGLRLGNSSRQLQAVVLG